MSDLNGKINESSHFTKDDQTSDSSRKFVTFSKNTEILPIRHNTAPNDNSKNLNFKPDLPGRVSFSKNDVYELDYSDFENNYDKCLMDTKFNKNIIPSITVDNLPLDVGKKFCCPMKCNAINCSTEEVSKEDEKYIPERYQDDSDQIIEDYKREIEQINREHNKQSSKSNLQVAPSSDSGIYSTNERVKENYVTSTKKCDEEQLNDMNDSIDKPNICDSTPKDININAFQQMNLDSNSFTVTDRQITNSSRINFKPVTKIKQSSMNPPTNKDTSVSIISNYLKVTNQDQLNKSSAIKNNKILKDNKIKTSNDSKLGSVRPTSNTNRLTGQNKLKLFSSACQEETGLNEFQMDKVESWMSVHAFTEINEKNVVTTVMPDSNDKETYNQSWRETPSSKTDDEGNYSFEDQLDTESTYDEIVSVIKEIDDQKCDDDKSKYQLT